MDLVPVPLDSATFPPNIRFEVDDVNHGLRHFAGQFDLVQARSVTIGIKDAPKTIKDLQLCLKPGGLLLLIEGDTDMWGEDYRKLPMAKVDGDGDVSGVSETGSWFQRLHWGMSWMMY